MFRSESASNASICFNALAYARSSALVERLVPVEDRIGAVIGRGVPKGVQPLLVGIHNQKTAGIALVVVLRSSARTENAAETCRGW